MFLPFPGWQVLVGFIVSAAVMGYVMVPLAFGAMRRQEPDHPRPFKLPAGEVLAPIAFIVANLAIYWTGWDILVVAAFSLAIYFYAISVRLTPEEVHSHVADARDEAEEEEELAV
jgi:amino acid transporter